MKKQLKEKASFYLQTVSYTHLMAMKKRFLGLAMAAMVAMPASSAYAWTASGDTLTGNNTDTMTQTVTVTGDIKSSQGTCLLYTSR